MVIELLAEAEGRPPAEMAAELAAHGPMLDIDSLRIVEILVEVEDRFGVDLPADPVTARSTRSVLTFARAVVNAILEGDEDER